ncbi:enoyl-CoA hydratase/carnithine racemase [Embleya sp. AB8]
MGGAVREWPGVRAASGEKEAIDRGLEVDLATGLELERLQFTALFATKDRATGMHAFVAKEEPKFSSH